ncbi:hypothetical protein B0H16DRAFT_1852013 [Mycena metata]|uniref:Uncharacterized protein n=1 Tax=Mycena metata TaxID=1033252 RepID=A0AAD7N5Z7_9AGAR|nr:hypothetical protein B0H16DRAFT_1852013 [Mycena metata]
MTASVGRFSKWAGQFDDTEEAVKVSGYLEEPAGLKGKRKGGWRDEISAPPKLVSRQRRSTIGATSSAKNLERTYGDDGEDAHRRSKTPRRNGDGPKMKWCADPDARNGYCPGNGMGFWLLVAAKSSVSDFESHDRGERQSSATVQDGCWRQGLKGISQRTWHNGSYCRSCSLSRSSTTVLERPAFPPGTVTIFLASYGEGGNIGSSPETCVVGGRKVARQMSGKLSEKIHQWPGEFRLRQDARACVLGN